MAVIVTVVTNIAVVVIIVVDRPSYCSNYSVRNSPGSYQDAHGPWEACGYCDLYASIARILWVVLGKWSHADRIAWTILR